MTVKSPRLAAFETLYKIQQESAYAGRIGTANHFGRFGG